MPSDILQRGKNYFWQVEAIVEGRSRLSPAVGFWIVDLSSLQQVLEISDSYPNSEVVLASVYAEHGLFEEALAQVDRLALIQPKNPVVQKMQENLRNQLAVVTKSCYRGSRPQAHVRRARAQLSHGLR